MRNLTKLLFISLFLLCSVDMSSGLLASTSYGQVQSSNNVNGTIAYLGIPYARPPLGRLKFRRAQRAEPWSPAVLSGSTWPASCQQLVERTASPAGVSEDCLYLNVFVPEGTNLATAELPVFVWLHGGGNELGSSAQYLADDLRLLLDNRLIVVTVNFRLGFWGFFSTPSPSRFQPNLALWDQQQALMWINAEIKAFGGDPTRVTLAGHGTGAGAVALHLYNQRSSQLFLQAILQSGSSLAPFAIAGNRYKIETSKLVAIELGCITESGWDESRFDDPVFEQCILTASPEDVWRATFYNAELVSGANYDLIYQPLWAPTIDGDYIDTMVPQRSDRATKSLDGKVVMLGTTKDEKAQLALSPVLQPQADGSLRNNTASRSRFDWVLGLLARPEAFGGYEDTVRQMLDFVYGDRGRAEAADDMDQYWINATSRLASDYYVTGAVVAEAEQMRRQGAQVYLYSFDYTRGSSRLVPRGADVQLMFPNMNAHLQGFTQATADSRLTRSDRIIREQIGTLWSNFIKTSNPNLPNTMPDIRWSQFSSSTPLALSLNDQSTMVPANTAAANLWFELMPKITNLANVPVRNQNADPVINDPSESSQSSAQAASTQAPASNQANVPAPQVVRASVPQLLTPLSSGTLSNSQWSTCTAYIIIMWVLILVLLLVCVLFVLMIYRWRQQTAELQQIRSIH